MNVALLEEIKAHILAEPHKLIMDTWACETAYCIAGLALHLSGISIVNPTSSALVQVTTDGRYPAEAAAAVLELPYEPDSSWPGEVDRLFQLEDWPEDLQERWADTKEDWCDNPIVDRAQIAAERITRFIATNGAD